MIDVSITGALLAGFISFISPCVLPIVPPYLAYIAGVSVSEISHEHVSKDVSRRVLVSSVFFVLGFSTVFVALGASANVIGQAVTQYFDALSIAAGVVIMLMGLHFLGLLRIGFLYREARVDVQGKSGSPFWAYVMGLAFAFGWTPCVGPILAAILFVAGAEETALRGAFLLLVYSLGIGIPFIMAALFFRVFVGWMRSFSRHLGKVEKAMGALLVLTGILFVTGSMPVIAQWFLETFPTLGTYG